MVELLLGVFFSPFLLFPPNSDYTHTRTHTRSVQSSYINSAFEPDNKYSAYRGVALRWYSVEASCFKFCTAVFHVQSWVPHFNCPHEMEQTCFFPVFKCYS